MARAAVDPGAASLLFAGSVESQAPMDLLFYVRYPRRYPDIGFLGYRRIYSDSVVTGATKDPWTSRAVG
jgi:hypothetical protein